MSLYEKLRAYCKDDYIPMHMPGAKRNTQLLQMEDPYSIDITEIDGFDNMHHPEDIIKNGFHRCAKLFGAEESLYLVNGSSAGIMAAICGATQKKDKVIVARNSHKSVYHALYLNELNPVYIYPELVNNAGIYGAVSADDVENLIKANEDATAVIITSPTYEGIVSDIKRIAEVAHQHNMVLIVDEAHGAHFNFSSYFPESAVKCGADAVIQSIHKTLPSFTQTALLHLNGNMIDRNRVKMYWDMYQTTSPSYILMSGIDQCMTLLENQGPQLFKEYELRLNKLRNQLTSLKHFHLMDVDDPSKIVLLVSNAKRLYDILIEKYKIQLEMTSVSYVIAMTSIADTDHYYERFLSALQELDEIWEDESQEYFSCSIGNAQVVCNSFDAINADAKGFYGLDQCLGKVSAGSICFYPPGIPLLHPGERITQQVIDIIRQGVESNLEILGLHYNREEIEILCLK